MYRVLHIFFASSFSELRVMEGDGDYVQSEANKDGESVCAIPEGEMIENVWKLKFCPDSAVERRAWSEEKWHDMVEPWGCEATIWKESSRRLKASFRSVHVGEKGMMRKGRRIVSSLERCFHFPVWWVYKFVEAVDLKTSRLKFSLLQLSLAQRPRKLYFLSSYLWKWLSSELRQPNPPPARRRKL